MKDFIILDGAMGTMLQKRGLEIGERPELWNLYHPEIVTEIGRKYIEAGSNVIYANTFGANRHKINGVNVADVISAGVKCAKEASDGTCARVALDVGPIGVMLKPLGTLSFDLAYDIYKEIVIAGEKAGADLIVFETMSDLYEVKAAVLAAKENTSLPVWVTMTFEQNARTFLGVCVEAMAMTLTGLGVDALGFNCSLGPTELLPMVKTLSEWTELPIILKPNAGLPDPTTGEYFVTPEEFASALICAAESGVRIFGGCCGTTPEYIAAIKEKLCGVRMSAKREVKHHGLCSPTKAVSLDGVRVIGERINPTGKKRFKQALLNNDIQYILSQGIEQVQAGADILDVNVGLPGINEPQTMKNIVENLQSVVELPLQIDSSDALATETGLRYYNGKAIVNSVNGEKCKLDTILPLCKKYGAAVIGLTMDENGIPETSEGRIEIAKRILDAALKYGIKKEDVYIDCLTLTVSAQPLQARETLKALKYVHDVMGLHTTLGVSNISFGLPERDEITSVFLCEALACGLDLPIINPNTKAVMDAVFSHRVLSYEDKNCESYIERFSGITKEKADSEKSESTIEGAILRGLGEECKALCVKALETLSELEIINTLLIPALDAVGEKYEKGEIFLPGLINAASAAGAGFEVIKASIVKNGKQSVSRGKIVLATVKGDIHDIGKNIVKVVLENYGFNVIDLGRDVAPETVVDAIKREGAHLVGLSALMTTTLVSMEETVKLVKNKCDGVKVMVGGAVLTSEYAKEIGADYYARDAKESASIAGKVLG